MFEINDVFDAADMMKYKIERFDTICCTEEYRHYQIVAKDRSFYNLYMMHEHISIHQYEEPVDILAVLEDGLNSEHNWLITIQIRNEYTNLKVFDYISLYRLEELLEGQFSCFGELELLKNVIGHLMRSSGS